MGASTTARDHWLLDTQPVGMLFGYRTPTLARCYGRRAPCDVCFGSLLKPRATSACVLMLRAKRTSVRDLDRYDGIFTPVSRTTVPHSASSRSISAAKSSGEPSEG